MTNNSPVFLLGAGFNYDASSEAGDPKSETTGQFVKYPLLDDLLDICFGLQSIPKGKSIEDLFQDSIDAGDKEPIEKLYELLMRADYEITNRLKCGGSHENNAYTKFLRNFPESPLLNYNYDSLPEILLLAEREWCPYDGYGVPVMCSQQLIRRGKTPVTESLRPVLHLHGSLCIYPSTFEIDKNSDSDYPLLKFDVEPKYLFDPDTIGSCFHPYTKVAPGVTYTYVDERVIAPVPNKTIGLKSKFIEAVNKQAIEIFRDAERVVVIGYCFNPSDSASYSPLLNVFSGDTIMIVSPGANDIVERLKLEHPQIQWVTNNMSFKEWSDGGYPGG